MIERAGVVLLSAANSINRNLNDINHLDGRDHPPIEVVSLGRIPPHQQEDKGLT